MNDERSRNDDEQGHSGDEPRGYPGWLFGRMGMVKVNLCPGALTVHCPEVQLTCTCTRHRCGILPMAYSPSGPWAAPLLDVRPGNSLTESIDDGCRKQGSSNRRPSRAQHEGAESETASWDWRGSSTIFSSLAIKIVIFSGGPHPL